MKEAGLLRLNFDYRRHHFTCDHSDVLLSRKKAVVRHKVIHSQFLYIQNVHNQ